MTGLFDLSNKRALVTGGAQGLGRMMAEGLLRAGASVAITTRRPEVAAAAEREMGAFGRCTAYAGELSTPDEVADLARRYREDHDTLDILVNNAGRTWGAPIGQFPDKAWAGIMAVNVQTPFTLVQTLLPLLEQAARPDDPARVVNIGSVAGMRPERLGAYSYAASKAAIHMLTRDLAADLAARHITVNALVPGFFPTKMTAHLRDADEAVDPALLARIPAGRLGRADDIAGALVFLASRAGAYVTGTLLPVDGGLVGCA